MFYVDTSVIVAALTPEAATKRAQTWLGAAEAGLLAVSGWVITEFSSALSIRLRTQALTLDDRAEILAAWRRLLDDSLVVGPVTPRHFETAARFLDQHALGLRAADALHLAIAGDQGMTLATLDRHLAGAGPKLGIPTLAL